MKTAKEERIALERPETTPPPMINHGSSTESWGHYRKPDGVAAGEKFYVKVQASLIPMGSLLVYDKTRQCTFYIERNKRGYHELDSLVGAVEASNGIKSFMLASFDENGVCSIYPGSATLKK